MQTGTGLFSSLIYRNNGAAKRRQPGQFLLDILEPFMPLPVSDLVHGCVALFKPILLVQLMNLSDLLPQTPDLYLENS